MEEKNYYKSFEEFLKENPEIDPSWGEFIEPVIKGSEDAIYQFIISVLYM